MADARELITQLLEGQHSEPSVICEDLMVYEQLLRKWQPVQNLVSRETLDQLWMRHFADSVQLLPLLSSRDQLIVDIGSGGGFPALPLAAALKGKNVRFELYEPVSRKAAFLKTVVRELDLNAAVYAQRIEKRDSRETVDVFTSRALAPLHQLLAWVEPHCAPDTRCLLHKGREHVEEAVTAATQFEFDMIQHRSKTDDKAAILELAKLRRRQLLA